MARKMKTMDGNTAVAHASYAFTDVAAIYPITPSSVMADVTDNESANGRTNLFGRPVQVTEMQSEGGAAGPRIRRRKKHKPGVPPGGACRPPADCKSR